MVILTFLILTLMTLIVALIVLTTRLVQRLRILQQIDARLAHFGDGLALLTEATETGFQLTASEFERVVASQQRHQRLRDVSDRVEEAAALGETPHQIASAEGLSEGEVQLRLHLAQTRGAATHQEAHLGAM